MWEVVACTDRIIDPKTLATLGQEDCIIYEWTDERMTIVIDSGPNYQTFRKMRRRWCYADRRLYEEIFTVG